MDIDDRKLQYLNATARQLSPDERKKIDEEYPDVIAHMRGDQPAKRPVFSPEQPVPKTIEDLIADFGAAAVVEAALPFLTDEESDQLLPKATVEAKATSIDDVLAALPRFTLEDLNRIFEALPALIDAGGAPKSDLPDGWRKLHWKQKVQLVVERGGAAVNGVEADAFLEGIEKNAAIL